MKGTKLLGAVLLVLGILAVAYGGFSYTKSTDKVNIGPIHFEVDVPMTNDVTGETSTARRVVAVA